jgi:hypothetical protein
MPSYVIAKSLGKVGEAVLCDPDATGLPDRGTDVPVEIEFVSERVLCVDGEQRPVIWGTGENGTATYLVEGSSRAVRNRGRRLALTRASGLLRQLTSTLMALARESEEPEFVAENLQLLSKTQPGDGDFR